MTSFKRIQNLRKKIEDKEYCPEEGISLLKETGSVKFIESVEAHICLNLNPKYADQQLRATVSLPHGTGKNLRIAVVVKNLEAYKQEEIGADYYGSESFIDEINLGKINFDILIAEPEIMPKLSKVGRILGPKGLMPSPKSGTVTKNLKNTVEEFKKGKLEYKIDKNGILHILFGKVNFTSDQLLDNLKIVFKSIVQNKPSGAKGKYIKKIFICTSMGPSIKIDPALF